MSDQPIAIRAFAILALVVFIGDSVNLAFDWHELAIPEIPGPPWTTAFFLGLVNAAITLPLWWMIVVRRAGWACVAWLALFAFGSVLLLTMLAFPVDDKSLMEPYDWISLLSAGVCSLLLLERNARRWVDTPSVDLVETFR